MQQKTASPEFLILIYGQNCFSVVPYQKFQHTSAFSLVGARWCEFCVNVDTIKLYGKVVYSPSTLSLTLIANPTRTPVQRSSSSLSTLRLAFYFTIWLLHCAHDNVQTTNTWKMAVRSFDAGISLNPGDAGENYGNRFILWINEWIRIEFIDLFFMIFFVYAAHKTQLDLAWLDSDLDVRGTCRTGTGLIVRWWNTWKYKVSTERTTRMNQSWEFSCSTIRYLFRNWFSVVFVQSKECNERRR